MDFRIDAACAFTGREHVFQIDTCDEEGAPDRALAEATRYADAYNAYKGII